MLRTDAKGLANRIHVCANVHSLDVDSTSCGGEQASKD